MAGGARTGRLGSPLGLAVRLAEGPALAWALGLGLFGMLIGLVARTAAAGHGGLHRRGTCSAQLGIEGSGTRAYVGVSFVFITLALISRRRGPGRGHAGGGGDQQAGQPPGPPGGPGTLAGREVGGRQSGVLAAGRPRPRSWAPGRPGTPGAWASGWGDLAAAGVNTIPAALFIPGPGTLAQGCSPGWR